MTYQGSTRDDVINEFRANHGKVGGMFAAMPMLLLTTRGARSGSERVNPVAYTRDGENLVVIASKGGAPTSPGWYHNLIAGREAVVEVGDERDRLYAVHAAAMPQFAEYQRRTTRRIPVVVLHRV
jgi:deazaflavin-dependent oxidoreductase (nitroreductase family)